MPLYCYSEAATRRSTRRLSRIAKGLVNPLFKTSARADSQRRRPFLSSFWFRSLQVRYARSRGRERLRALGEKVAGVHRDAWVPEFAPRKFRPNAAQSEAFWC